MTKGQIEQLVSRWMAATLDLCEDYRAERLPTMDDDEVDDQWMGCSNAFDEAHGAMLAGEYKSVQDELEGLLSSAQLPALDPTSPAYARLAREFLKAKQLVYELEMARWGGDFMPVPRY